MTEGVKVLEHDELERIRRRLADLGPWDDAVRLLATIDAAIIEVRYAASAHPPYARRDHAERALGLLTGQVK